MLARSGTHSHLSAVTQPCVKYQAESYKVGFEPATFGSNAKPPGHDDPIYRNSSAQDALEITYIQYKVEPVSH